MRRSANSDTMMASSTSMPTARMSENSTTMFTVSPARCSPSTPARNEAGIAMPMNKEARKPSANSMITVTSRTAVTTEFCKSASMVRMVFDLSWLKVTSTPSGQVAFSFSTSAFTPSTVSIRLAPVRLDTSMVIADWPFTRVTEVASLKVGRTCATSPTVTVAPDVAATGTFKTSCGFSIRPGTLTAKRPVSPSSAPAAIRLFEALTVLMSWSSETP
jgi:hypothetical protein